MIIANERKVSCRFCKETITVYEYEGLEGALYSDHFCEAEKLALKESN